MKCITCMCSQCLAARLHDAAPDLLAALKALRDWHKHEYQSNRAIDAQADAAIAKAEGHAPR